MCGRRSKQRRLLKPAFLSGLKYWGLGKPVCVYAARDLTPRGKHITWYSENLLGGFREVGGTMAPSSLLQVHTHKGKQDGGQWGIFTNFDIFSTLFLYSI